MIRFFLVVTGIISFLYFLFPGIFTQMKPQGDVLGIDNISALVNKQTVETALLSACLSEGQLPENLNYLYNAYLEPSKKTNLDDLFAYKIVESSSCLYTLSVK